MRTLASHSYLPPVAPAAFSVRSVGAKMAGRAQPNDYCKLRANCSVRPRFELGRQAVDDLHRLEAHADDLADEADDVFGVVGAVGVGA